MKYSILALFLSIIIYLAFDNYAPHKVLKKTSPKEVHRAKMFHGIFNETAFENLKKLAKTTRFGLNIRNDNTKEFYYASSEPDENGNCPHRFQHINSDKTKCILPGRLDVGKHMMMTGGYGSKKETYEKLISRSKFFQHFWADFNPKSPQMIPEVLDLFEQPYYRKETELLCHGQQYLDPLQSAILIALPGQEVPMHFDTAFFFGADRNVFPIWLLTAMRHSGLYDDRAIYQVQGIAYLHEWENPSYGGGFYYYDEGPAGDMKIVPPTPNAGLISDGIIMAHGTETFQPQKEHIRLDKDKNYYVQFNSTTSLWDLYEEDSTEIFKSFIEDDVRISLVWRQRCFDSKEEFLRFRQENYGQDQLDVYEVIDHMLNHLIKTGKIQDKPKSEIDTVETILNHYVKYPYPDSIFPYNYCMAAKMFPSLKPIFKYFCD